MTKVSVTPTALATLAAAVQHAAILAQHVQVTATSDDQLELAFDASCQANEEFMVEREELKADLEVAQLELLAAQNERDEAIKGLEQFTAQLTAVALYVNSLQQQLNAVGVTWAPSEVHPNTPAVSIDVATICSFIERQAVGV